MKAIRDHGRLARFAGLSLLLLSAGCAARVEQINDQNVGPLVDQFVDGKAVLDCDLPCAGRFGANRKAMFGMYQASDWSTLSRTVVRIGFNQDLSWFYLGLSAQGLGLADSAAAYYSKALETPNHCASGAINACDGFAFPDDIYTQLQAMGVEM